MRSGSVGRYLLLLGLWLWPQRCPAPLIYTPGEGWHYEAVGEGRWTRPRPKDQLEVAQAAFDQKDYSRALKAARRTVTVWPLSDYAPQAQQLLARCYEAKGNDEKAFKEYQNVLDRYPTVKNFDEILQRQFDIANRFQAGQHFRLWGVLPLYSSMPKTIKLYEQIIKTGRYSAIAPQAQMNIARAHEQQKVFGCIRSPDYAAAAKAYETAADRYSDRPAGTEALFNLGVTYAKQAATAEYDQSVAGQAITTFTDFLTLHPADARVPRAQRSIDALKSEQARGSFEIAGFYEKKHRWQGALIYYNEVLLYDPASKYAEQARRRIVAIQKILAE